ncbi:MAG: B12-binding domain-containing radical SAM protein [Candidatus Marinimicrobia bacterium]|nr:B12-binding domain-containing radical SAM protein [Candidatus Neomarinimicrobiota bacterium]
MSCVLASPPYGTLFGTPKGTPALHEPLGLEYIAATALQCGYSCKVASGLPIDHVTAAQELAAYDANVYGVGLSTPASSWVASMLSKLRELRPNAVFVVGGDHPSSTRELVLQDGNIDFGVAGEGEEAFKGVLEVIAGRLQRESVPGLIWRDTSGRARSNTPCSIENLDQLPAPVRSAKVLSACRVDGLIYPAPSVQESVAQIMQSRGCPNACGFCSSRLVFGKGIRFRSPELVAAEMTMLSKEYGVNLAFFADLHLGAEFQHTKALCKAIVRAGKPIPWYASMTTSSMSREMADVMANAGCTKVALGIESMDPQTHKRLRPWSDIETAAEAVVTADTAGLLVRAYYMIGNPGETRESFRLGIESLCQLPVDELRIAFFTPFPGTPAYRRFSPMLITDKAEDLTSAKPILDLPGYSPEHQQEDYNWARQRFYGGPEYASKWRDKLLRNPIYERSYADFFVGLKEDGISVDY